MVDVENLEVVRVVPTGMGLFVFARYPEWRYEYNFYIANNGHVEGKTTAGNWLELSVEAARSIGTKARTVLENFHS